MRIWLDPTRMASLGVTANDVRAALAANNFTTAAGEVKGDYTQISVNALTSLDSAKAFGQLVITAHGDALVRLGDVAKIELGPQSVNSSSVFDGLKAVFVGIYGTPEANPLTVINGVRAIMPSIQEQLPVGLRATVAYDSTTFIRASIYEVAKTLFEAAAIVIVVIFLFLGNLRSTFIPIVTIPLSLVGVMIALMALGYSINLLTLLALVLGIGLVVDDAIVVVENIHRHIEEGMTPFDAAIKGAREIALPIIAMTITLAAVYAPIGFVSGVTGVLFREFAFTLAGAVIVSGFIALTLSPMMCSKLLSREKSEGWFARDARSRLPRSSPRLQAPPPQHAQLPRAHPPHPGWRAGAHRRHVRLDPARARSRGGPGHSAFAGQDAAGRQPRLYRAGDHSAWSTKRAGSPKSRTSSPSTASPTSATPSSAFSSSPGTSAARTRSRS